MTGTEVIDIAKKVNKAVPNDVFMRALKRIETLIAKTAEIKDFVFDENENLLASGGVYDGYDDLYEVYLKREAALSIEDWDCFSSYDALYAIRWSDLNCEIVKKHKPENQSFRDWRWN